MTFLELLRDFPTETSMIDHFIKLRYKGKPVCPHCGTEKVYQRNNNHKLFDCNNPECHNTFSPFTNTIFEKSSTDMRKWFYAIHVFLNGKKGISACQLQREIGGSYKTSWRMLQEIRIAMGREHQREFFDTVIEMDETYIGAKSKTNRNDDDKGKGGGKRGRGTSKAAVIGVIDRNNKVVYAQAGTKNINGQVLSGKQLLAVLNKVSKETNRNVIITDEFRGYNYLGGRYIHLKIDHDKTYSNGMIHTNNIESFWATLKRGIYGMYHHVSAKYLQRYIDEFCFRYNHRKDDMFTMVLRQGILA